METKLERLRERIDEIDKKIVNLIEKRLEIVRRIGKIKKERKLDINDSLREREVLKNVSESTPIDKEFVRNLFKSIIDYCKNEEQK